jgi:hypothetical protein
MFKNVILALVPLVMLGSQAMASDDLLNELANSKGENIADASIEVEEFDLDLDVDELAESAGTESEDAIEACFRRFGFGGGYGYGRRGYGYGGWGYGYRPIYNHYRCYRPLFCGPIYRTYHSYCAPYVNYWGCY